MGGPCAATNVLIRRGRWRYRHRHAEKRPCEDGTETGVVRLWRGTPGDAQRQRELRRQGGELRRRGGSPREGPSEGSPPGPADRARPARTLISDSGLRHCEKIHLKPQLVAVCWDTLGMGQRSAGHRGQSTDAITAVPARVLRVPRARCSGDQKNGQDLGHHGPQSRGRRQRHKHPCDWASVLCEKQKPEPRKFLGPDKEA